MMLIFKPRSGIGLRNILKTFNLIAENVTRKLATTAQSKSGLSDGIFHLAAIEQRLVIRCQGEVDWSDDCEIGDKIGISKKHLNISRCLGAKYWIR